MRDRKVTSSPLRRLVAHWVRSYKSMLAVHDAQPVFCNPCDTPLTQATNAVSSASSLSPPARQRFNRSTCSRLIGST